jgi:outer membrane protein OmpA-like peptidoglycan-associated protein
MKYLLSIVLLFCVLFVFTQNLVSNGGFENGGCPLLRGDDYEVCEKWHSIATGDYFTYCSKGEVGIGSNFIGYQVPNSGLAYSGIFTGNKGTKNNTEFLFTELKSTLVKDSVYYFRLFYCLAEKSGMRGVGIGVALTENLVFEKITTPFGVAYQEIEAINYAFTTTNEIALADSVDWNVFEVEYQAKGGERYMYISGIPIKEKGVVSLNKEKKTFYNDYAYYYIDDVALMKVNDKKQYYKNKKTIDSNRYSQNNIAEYRVFFDEGKGSFDKVYNKKLDSVVQVSQLNPKWTIEVSGYTDPVGEIFDNMILSKRRVDEVVKYLTMNGVNEAIISKQYFGETSGGEQINATNQYKDKRKVTVIFLH